MIPKSAAGFPGGIFHVLCRAGVYSRRKAAPHRFRIPHFHELPPC